MYTCNVMLTVRAKLKVIPNRAGEVRSLLRTRDRQSTVWRDGESLLNHLTTGR